jgi:hypothetical protein
VSSYARLVPGRYSRMPATSSIRILNPGMFS